MLKCNQDILTTCGSYVDLLDKKTSLPFLSRCSPPTQRVMKLKIIIGHAGLVSLLVIRIVVNDCSEKLSD